MSSAIVPVYARADLAFERGDGCWLTSTEGERYLDFGSGIAVAALGYSHPHLVEALAKQARKIWHTSNLYQIPEGERLAQRLAEATFADLVFFANSGAEANEAAIKMARKRQYVGGRPERYRVLTFEGAFHGRTLATIAAGGQAKYLEGFGPKVAGFDQIPLTDLDGGRSGDRSPDRRDHDRADHGRRRRARRRRRRSCAACARSATSTACCSSSTRSRPASAAPEAFSPMSMSASAPTS